MAERGQRGDVVDGPRRRRDDAAAMASRATLIRVGEETRVEVTLPLVTSLAENRFTAAATPTPPRATLRVVEMMALASSAAQAVGGAGGGAEGRRASRSPGGWRWCGGTMFVFVLSVRLCGSEHSTGRP